MYIPDNLDLFERHDAEQERARRKRPVCECCGEHIQQEKAICIDGDWYCKECENEAWERIKDEYTETIEE